jgi:hypothetical protein
MNSTRILGLVLLAGAAWLFLRPAPAGPKPPAPNAPAPPAPDCPGPNCPAPDPNPPRKPWAALASPAVAGADEPAVDLLAVPRAHRPNNVGGRDGAGLCVFTSIQYAAWWQCEPRLKDFQQKMRAEPGGGYPQKVDAMIAKHGSGAQYIQYQGSDPSVIEMALKTGRVPCITWGGNHMLNCVHLDPQRAGIVDNNAPDKVSWYPREQFLSKWRQGGGGWVVVLLNPPPAPPPTGMKRERQIAPGNELHGTFHRYPPRGVIRHEHWLPRPGEERWSINGKPVPRSLILAGVLTDDSARMHLTLIGAEPDRRRVLQDLNAAPELAVYRDRYLVQSYAPGDWEVGMGHVTTGRPTIYLQGRDGRVLLRRDAYAGPGDLAAALRRADPSYDPSKDPSGNPPGLPFDPSRIPPGALVCGALGALLLVKGGEEK